MTLLKYMKMDMELFKEEPDEEEVEASETEDEPPADEEEATAIATCINNTEIARVAKDLV